MAKITTKDKTVTRDRTITIDNTVFRTSSREEGIASQPAMRKQKADKNNELIPFAWRHPLMLKPDTRLAKTYKSIVESEAGRSALVPVDECK